MADKILARRDTAATWTSVNPVLALGEIAFETDTAKIKFGDGTTAWTSLGYVAGLSDADVRAAVEAASDSNVFTDTDHSKLDAIEAAADVTDATNVDTAGAVMDADISAGEGFLRKTGSGAYEAIKSEPGTTTAPGVSDDNTADWAVGSRWLDTTADTEYVCLDVTTGAAVWVETTGGGGGGPIPTEINFKSATDYTLVLTDAYKIIEMSSTSNRVLNIPTNASVDFDVGVLINVVKILTGDVTVTAASGVYLNGTNGGSKQLADFPWSGAALYQRSDNNWVINGALA